MILTKSKRLFLKELNCPDQRDCLSKTRKVWVKKSVKGSLLWIFEHKIFIVTEHRTYSIKREKMGNHVFSPTTSIYTVWPGVCTKKIHFITCLKLTNISFCLMWGFPSLRWDFTVYTVTLPVLRVFHCERCRIRTRDNCLSSLKANQHWGGGGIPAWSCAWKSLIKVVQRQSLGACVSAQSGIRMCVVCTQMSDNSHWLSQGW